MASFIQQPPTVQFQPVIHQPPGQVVQAQDPKLRRQKFKNILYGLGITELVLGIVFVLLGFINLGRSLQSKYYFHMSQAAPATWCSILLIACGALGIHTKKNSSVCVYNANMILSILSALMMSVLFIFSVILAISWETGTIVTNSILAIGSFSAMVVCIVHSAYCCAGICCKREYYPGQVVYMTPHQPSQQYVQLANGQYVMVQVPFTTGYPPQNFGPGSLQGIQQPPSYVHPPPAQTVNFPDSQPSIGALPTQYQQVPMAETVSPPPKFPVTFEE